MCVGADRLHLSALQEPQEHGLHAKTHLADFVEEDRAHVGSLELSWLITIGAGEAALHVTEQFGFEECLGQASAIDGREDMVGSRSARMDRARDDFLADTALARDQNFCVGPGNTVDLLLERQDLGAATSQLDMRPRPNRADRADPRTAAFSDAINHCS